MSDESPTLSTEEIASILRRRRRPKKSLFWRVILALCRCFRRHKGIILIILAVLGLVGLLASSAYVLYNVDYFISNSYLIVVFITVPTIGFSIFNRLSENAHRYYNPELYEDSEEEASPSSASDTEERVTRRRHTEERVIRRRHTEEPSDPEERVTRRRHTEEPSDPEERVTRRRHSEEPSDPEERVTRRRHAEEPRDTERRATRPRRRRRR